jgi:hypothetical protein
MLDFGNSRRVKADALVNGVTAVAILAFGKTRVLKRGGVFKLHD